MYDKDQYQQWLHHPCTKELQKIVNEQISKGINAFLNGTFLNGSDSYANFARHSGISAAYQNVLDIISIYLKMGDKEDSKNV